MAAKEKSSTSFSEKMKKTLRVGGFILAVSPDSKNVEQRKIRDWYYIHHIYFLMLGTLSFLPIYFFITAHDYWMYKFRSPNSTVINTARNDLQKNFTSTYSITRSVTTAFSLLLGMVLSKTSLRIRIALCLLMNLVIFIIDIILVEVNTDTWQYDFFVLTMVLTVLITVPSDILYVSMLQFSMKFPPKYFGSFLSGDVICGVASGIVQVICLYLGSDSLSSGLIYFSIGAGYIAVSMLLHFVLTRTQCHQYHVEEVIKGNAVEKFDISMIRKVIKDNMVALIGTVVEYIGTTISTGTRSLVVSELVGNGNPWNEIYFVPVVTFLTFNGINLFGKIVAIQMKPGNKYVLCVLSFVRLLMVFLFMICNAQPRYYLPVVFGSDYQYILMVLVFGFSGGFLNAGQIMLTSRESPAEEQYLATFSLIYISTIFIGIFSAVDVVLVNLL